MFQYFSHGEKLRPLVAEVEATISERHRQIAALVDTNQLKVLRSFQKHEVNEFHFSPSTGYGYDDSGRATLESIYADVFGGEAALVRPHIISGTHAIAISLFGILRPGDDLLYMTSIPWVSFTSVMHPLDLHPVDSVPRFAWGKYFKESDLLKMPLSVQAHHALMDGIHAGRFYTIVQDYLYQPDSILA